MTSRKKPIHTGGDTELERERAKAERMRRAAEVRRKYDFGVIRTLRQRRGLTIEQFARECGLSYAPISRIETNLIKPNLETLDKVASGLGISTYNLVAMAERRETRVQDARDFNAGEFIFQATGHGFNAIPCVDGSGVPGAGDCGLSMASRTFAGCATSGCHTDEDDAFTKLRDAAGRLETLVNNLDGMNRPNIKGQVLDRYPAFNPATSPP